MGVVVGDIVIPDIDEELSRQLKEAGGEENSRACLFNLIVYVDDKERAPHFSTLVKKVVSKFPSRVIFIIEDQSSEQSSLKVSADLQTIHEGEAKIFCEKITLDLAGGSYTNQVPFIIIPYLLPDLPIYLLWTQDPKVENRIFPHVAPYADRIIFDSGAKVPLQEFCRSIFSVSPHICCEVGDLNWSAISGWRKLFTQTFNSKESIDILEQTHHLVITYVEQAVQAAYFQAWLSCRLNWKFDSFELIEGNIRISYRLPSHETVVFLKPKKAEGLPSGTILSVELDSLLNQTSYHFLRKESSQMVCVQISDKEQCFLPISAYLPGVREGQEIIEEIFYPPAKQHYLLMLETLCQIPWRSP